MNETIEKLIASGKEGPWWDFKQTYHQNNAALVHDILCMANVLHDGDRYLIFGVNDEGLITGVPEDGKQLNQANLIDLLRKVSFAEHHCPIFSCTTSHSSIRCWLFYKFVTSE